MNIPVSYPLVSALEAAALPVVLMAMFEGQRGHPVRFASACGDALAALQGNQGAAPVVSARAAIKIVVNDPGCITDIDTLDDLQRAERLLQAAS